MPNDVAHIQSRECFTFSAFCMVDNRYICTLNNNKRYKPSLIGVWRYNPFDKQNSI